MPLSITLRGKTQPLSDAQVRRFEDADAGAAFAAALACVDHDKPEPVLEWGRNDGALAACSALDVDFHGRTRPDALTLSRLVMAGQNCPVAPAFAWSTHGRGYRAVFLAAGDLAADELAAAHAATLLFGRASTASGLWTGFTGIEIKAETRHPAYPRADGATAGPVAKGHAGNLQDAAAALYGDAAAEVDDDAVSAWLEENGYERGKAYDHSRCPFDPARPSHGTPVWIGDFGLTCSSCKEKGPKGFISWGRLIDGASATSTPSRVRAMARNLTHFEHARHVLAVEWAGLAEPIREKAYRALLKIAHADSEAKKPLIDRVFFPPLPMVRGPGVWVHAADLATPHPDKAKDRLLNCLPAVLYADEKGAVKVDSRQLGIFHSDMDLTAYGYAAVSPLTGCDLRGSHPEGLEWSDGIFTVVPAARTPFTFMPKAERDRRKTELEGVFADQFPGLNLPLLRLLIAAKGYAQRQPHGPPLIALTGQTGAGKSATVLLAAELTRDTATSARVDGDLREVLMSVGTAAGRDGYLLLDEITKGAAGPEIEKAILGIQRGVMARILYRGYVKLERLPVIVLADTALHPVLRESAQLSRRVVHVDLGGGATGQAVDWKETCYGAEITGWRSTLPGSHDAAADWIVSEVLDDLMGYRSFTAAAAALGFPCLRDATADLDVNEVLRTLFYAACHAPDTTRTHWKGTGWKAFEPRDDGSELAIAWRECVDPSEPGDFQRLAGADWGRIMGMPGLELDCRSYGKQIGLRFRVGNARSPETKFNADLIPDPPDPPERPDVLPMPARPDTADSSATLPVALADASLALARR